MGWDEHQGVAGPGKAKILRAAATRKRRCQIEAALHRLVVHRPVEADTDRLVRGHVRDVATWRDAHNAWRVQGAGGERRCQYGQEEGAPNEGRHRQRCSSTRLRISVSRVVRRAGSTKMIAVWEIRSIARSSPSGPCPIQPGT